MTGLTRARFRRLYGESPLHLLVLCAALAVCGYAAVRLLDADWLAVAIWFVGGALLHDVVFVPLYSGLDRLLYTTLGASRVMPDSAVHHVRVPAFVSLLLLLVYWPLVLRQAPRFALTTGLSPGVYLGHWLLITAALFAVSAVWLAVRLTRARPPS